MADTFFLRKADRSFGQHEQLFAGLRLEPPRPPAPERSPLSLSISSINSGQKYKKRTGSYDGGRSQLLSGIERAWRVGVMPKPFVFL